LWVETLDHAWNFSTIDCKNNQRATLSRCNGNMQWLLKRWLLWIIHRRSLNSKKAQLSLSAIYCLLVSHETIRMTSIMHVYTTWLFLAFLTWNTKLVLKVIHSFIYQKQIFAFKRFKAYNLSWIWVYVPKKKSEWMLTVLFYQIHFCLYRFKV